MLSLIEVECPHCGARGQIMVPPIGSMIIGPCPQCQELVVVFCGHVLALDKDVMQEGSTDDRREHLMTVLTEFLGERVSKLLLEEAPGEDELIADHSEDEDEAPQPRVAPIIEQGAGPISDNEIQRFTSVDLKLLDNDAYFKSVFDKK